MSKFWSGSFINAKYLRTFLGAALGFIVFTQTFLLSTVRLEMVPEELPGEMVSIDPNTLLPKQPGQEPFLVPNLPNDRIPEYHVKGFTFLSTRAGVKQWRILALDADMYQKEHLVHARTVTAFLPNPDKEPTVIQALEARYDLDARDIEMYGSVQTRFPDGFTIYSNYMRYFPNRREVYIPIEETVYGNGKTDDDKVMKFRSKGLRFFMDKNEIELLEDVHFTMIRLGERDPEAAGIPDETHIVSDFCLIDRTVQIAHFTMFPTRPLRDRFVYVSQPDLRVRSRRTDLNYGELPKLVDYMTAYEDVFIRELSTPKPTPKKRLATSANPERDLLVEEIMTLESQFEPLGGETPEEWVIPGSQAESAIVVPTKTPVLRYGTGNRADFDTKRNIIKLREFPQVYQDSDTVTGDIITIYRDTDIIEVDNSNAFSEAKSQE